MGCAVALASAASVLAACGGGPNESERYRDRVRIDGYRVIDKSYSDGATGIYVGPAGSNLSSAVSAPGLTVSRGETDWSNGIFKYVAEGTGRTEESGSCRVVVFQLDSGLAALQYADRNLDEAERDGILDGSASVVKVDVLCGAQADP